MVFRLQATRKFVSLSYVSFLAAFVSTGQQDDLRSVSLQVIHPVAGSVVNTEFLNPLTHRRHIPGFAEGQPSDAGQDTCPRSTISDIAEPTGVYVGLADLEHPLLYLIGYTIATEVASSVGEGSG